MVLQVSCLDETGAEPVYHTRIPFTARPSFRMHVVPLYRKGFVDVETDASRVPDMPQTFGVTVSIGRPGLTQTITTRTIKGLKPDKPRATTRFEIAI